jgi:hypothetical protein
MNDEDTMNEVDREERTVLAGARAGLSPTRADQERVRLALGATIAAAAPPASATPGSSTTAPSALRPTGWATRLIVASAIATSAGSAGYWAGRRADRRADVPPAVSVARSSPPAPEVAGWATREPTVPASAATTERQQPVARRPARSGGPSSTTGASETASSLDAELRALRNVERALRDREPGLALALLEELDRAVPRAQMREERDATATIARCALRRVPFGVDLAEEFAERHIDSAYLERVRQVCSSGSE